MYASLLTRRYLSTKLMPYVAVLAVTVCTAMVLVAWSVMGGFLDKLLASGRVFTGDVTITWPTVGFAHSDDLIRRLEARNDHVAAAAPLIQTMGVITLPDDQVVPITIRGIDPVRYARVVDWRGVLYWKPIDAPVPKDRAAEDPRLDPQWRARMEAALRDGLSMSRPDPVTGNPVPAAVPGIEVSGLSRRQPGAWYEFRKESFGKPNADGSIDWVGGFMPDRSVTVRVLPLDSKGRDVALVSKTLPVANEFRTDVFEIDKRSMLMPIDVLQKLLKMDESDAVAAEFNPYEPPGPDGFAPVPTTGRSPARVTSVVVKGQPGVAPDALLNTCLAVYREFADAHRGIVPSYAAMRGNERFPPRLIQTWEMSQAQFVGAVRNETGVVVTLLSFISLVASILILAIFWAMISEKTRDIGILRAIGASRAGVGWVWLRYGLLIGVIGGLLGVGLAYTVATNINEIHEWLGRAFGVQIWNPAVYYFTEIPRKVDPANAAKVFLGSVGFSLVGALVPALRAAWMDPVRALRFE